MSTIAAKGHCHPNGGRMVYDGRITYAVDDPPETIDVDGVLYWRIPDTSNIKVLEPDDAIVKDDVHGFRIARMTPEDGMRRVTRGASV